MRAEEWPAVSPRIPFVGALLNRTTGSTMGNTHLYLDNSDLEISQWQAATHHDWHLLSPIMVFEKIT
jgi:hypothetical protein